MQHLRPTLTVQERTAATATDFLLFLATYYWPSCWPLSFIHRPTIELNGPIDAVGNAVPNEYHLIEASFRLSGPEPAPGAARPTDPPIVDYRYASMAWAFKYDCRSMLVDFFKQLDVHRERAVHSVRDNPAVVVVWMWLAETYSMSGSSEPALAPTLDSAQPAGSLSRLSSARSKPALQGNVPVQAEELAHAVHLSVSAIPRPGGAAETNSRSRSGRDWSRRHRNDREAANGRTPQRKRTKTGGFNCSRALLFRQNGSTPRR